MIKRHIFFATLLMATLGLLSCSSTNSLRQPTQTAGTFSVSLTMDPDPPVPMQETVLELKLFDSIGQPISEANVSLDLTMPEMQMPKNSPKVVESSNGVYQAKTLFTMAGKWRIQVLVTYGEKSETFIFDLNTRE